MHVKAMPLTDSGRAEISVSDPAQLISLAELLRWAAPGVRVLPVHAPGPDGIVTGPGNLSGLVLEASTGGLIAAISILPGFIRTRPPGLSVTIAARGGALTLTAAHLDELMPAAGQLLDGSPGDSGARHVAWVGSEPAR
jgi:hypothetical protein